MVTKVVTGGVEDARNLLSIRVFVIFKQEFDSRLLHSETALVANLRYFSLVTAGY